MFFAGLPVILSLSRISRYQGHHVYSVYGGSHLLTILPILRYICSYEPNGWPFIRTSGGKMTPEGKCRSCGYHCVGWGLLNPKHQLCPNCGACLHVTNDGGRFEGLLARVRALIPAVLNNHSSKNRATTSQNEDTNQGCEPNRK